MTKRPRQNDGRGAYSNRVAFRANTLQWNTCRADGLGSGARIRPASTPGNLRGFQRAVALWTGVLGGTRRLRHPLLPLPPPNKTRYGLESGNENPNESFQVP